MTGDHHVAGVYDKDDNKPGWWNHVVGPGKALDTKTDFLLFPQIVLAGAEAQPAPQVSVQMEVGKLMIFFFQIYRLRI